MSGAGGDELVVAAETSIGSLDEAVSVTVQTAAVVAGIQKQVSIALAFVRGQYLLNAAPAVFSYYGTRYMSVFGVCKRACDMAVKHATCYLLIRLLK